MGLKGLEHYFFTKDYDSNDCVKVFGDKMRFFGPASGIGIGLVFSWTSIDSGIV